MASRCVILDIGGALEITPATGRTRRWSEQVGLSAMEIDEWLDDEWRAGHLGTFTEPDVHQVVSTQQQLS